MTRKVAVDPLEGVVKKSLDPTVVVEAVRLVRMAAAPGVVVGLRAAPGAVPVEGPGVEEKTPKLDCVDLRRRVDPCAVCELNHRPGPVRETCDYRFVREPDHRTSLPRYRGRR